mmetsp:Transcript_11857/g.21653  ORF Transcript_11857/g.21653 Transcript_11857/m.21653 type:complete len:424 (-) Transcript_11857:1820-3091(-)
MVDRGVASDILKIIISVVMLTFSSLQLWTDTVRAKSYMQMLVIASMLPHGLSIIGHPRLLDFPWQFKAWAQTWNNIASGSNGIYLTFLICTASYASLNLISRLPHFYNQLYIFLETFMLLVFFATMGWVLIANSFRATALASILSVIYMIGIGSYLEFLLLQLNYMTKKHYKISTLGKGSGSRSSRSGSVTPRTNSKGGKSWNRPGSKHAFVEESKQVSGGSGSHHIQISGGSGSHVVSSSNVVSANSGSGQLEMSQMKATTSESRPKGPSAASPDGGTPLGSPKVEIKKDTNASSTRQKTALSKTGSKRRKREEKQRRKAKRILRKLRNTLYGVPVVAGFAAIVAALSAATSISDDRSFREYYEESFGTGDNYSALGDFRDYIFFLINALFLIYAWHPLHWLYEYPVIKYFIPCWYCSHQEG